MTPATDTTPPLEFQDFLDEHLERELLRFTTAGSVDDGKSTLIGRLLHDTKAVYEDQLASIKQSRINRAAGPIDFSLLTDGLRAEREQGITIDVAYRYFSTSRRKFIIADTPGHEQYTRNMATGASTADLAIVLIDGSKGLLPQSRRHTYIASLLGIPHVVAAINKMDLVKYDEDAYNRIRADFLELARRLGIQNPQIIPLSALEGDNVVAPGSKMPWYDGPTLLEYLETVPLEQALRERSRNRESLRFPVQLVVRPDATFRGFAGQIASGVLRTGDEVVALPSGRRTRIDSIHTYDGELTEALVAMPITVRLQDEIDLSRGEMLVSPNALPNVSRNFNGKVVWLHADPLQPGRTYLAKHTSRVLRVQATAIHYRVDMHTLQELPATQLEMNDIASVDFSSNLPLMFDSYQVNRTMGSLILIDPVTNATVGAVMLERDLGAQAAEAHAAHIAPAYPLILTRGQAEAQRTIVGILHERSVPYVSLDDPYISALGFASAVRVAQLAGLAAVYSGDAMTQEIAEQVEQFLPRSRWMELPDGKVDTDVFLQTLHRILHSNDREENE
ncbi:MAG TPA: sulfate adenylyltransferase subunit CysN [Acidobacteriaceae bacterium]|jgi:bifunctional enzyme CysN/CysC/sulfate adenylyltransferase subunit 1|nr:sulfate adenylyltransferase subunit CysN [Acidobacteriaceae bacterium]